MKIKWTFCRDVEEEHRINKRQYAHTFHYAKTICTCHALWKLPKNHRHAILLHEIGHLLAGRDASEAEADRMIRSVTGCEIVYVDSSYGDDLESLEA